MHQSIPKTVNNSATVTKKIQTKLQKFPMRYDLLGDNFNMFIRLKSFGMVRTENMKYSGM